MPSVALARSPAEVQALLALKEAQRTMVVGMFGGTRLKFGVQAMVDNAKEVLLEGEDLANSVRTVVSTGKSVAKVTAAANPELIRTVCRTFIAQCAEVEDIGDVVAAIGGEAFADLMGEITPIIGIDLQRRQAGAGDQEGGRRRPQPVQAGRAQGRLPPG
jgi:hypothetical protein